MAFQYGSAVYPLDVGTSSTLLSVCDPALAKILDYLAFVIRKYADRAVQDAVKIRPLDGPSVSIRSAILQVVPIDPDSIARAEQFQFPILCAWPKSVKYADKTLNWTHDTRKVGLAYILPPLTAFQAVIWTPLLNAVSHICNAALKAGHDVDYNDDERILIDNQISAARLVDGDFGHYDFGGKATPPYFPAWVAELELVEQQAPYSVGLTSLAGMDVTATQQAKDDVVTFIAQDAAAGATSIRVASTDGFEALDVVRIGADTAREEVLSVTDVTDSTHLTLGAALVFDHTALQADEVKRDPVTMFRAKTEVG